MRKSALSRVCFLGYFSKTSGTYQGGEIPTKVPGWENDAALPEFGPFHRFPGSSGQIRSSKQFAERRRPRFLLAPWPSVFFEKWPWLWSCCSGRRLASIRTPMGKTKLKAWTL